MSDLRETFRLIRTTSLSDAIAHEIEVMILNGDLQPGSRVPEVELARRFAVSRSPVREAVRALDAVGLVEVVANRGAYVRNIAFSEAVELYEVRAALFAQAGRLMAQRGSDADIGRLVAMHEHMSASAGAHHFEEYAPLNFAFHELIVDAAGNRTLAVQYRMLVKRLRLFRSRNLMYGDTLAHSHKEHEEIVLAMRGRDGEAAAQACFEHVRLGLLRVTERMSAEEASQQLAETRSEMSAAGG